MNVTQMLLNVSTQTNYQPDRKRRPGAPSGARNPMHMKAVGRYKEHLQGQILSTPQLASKLGSSWSSNIIKTLYRLEALGLVKRAGHSKRTGQYGKVAQLWTWVNDTQSTNV